MDKALTQMSTIFDEYLNQKLPFLVTLKNYVKLASVKTLFEIGCCEAEDTVKLSRAFKNATIYAFEPLPKNIELARQHAKKYRVSGVEFQQLAFSNVVGEADFYVSSGKPKDAPEDPEWDYGNKSSSLLKPNRDIGLYEWIDFKEKITVPTDRLENFCKNNGIKKIDFLHMDVQGAELMVLEGSGGMIKHISSIWLEVEAVELYKAQPLEKEIEEFMFRQGFTCVLNTVGKINGDKLYINNNLLKSVWLKSAYSRKIPRAEKIETAKSLLAGKPRVTVLMSVYNSEDYLREAIDSILSQTFTDFEFLIINDGSIDNSLTIIQSYKDPRIRLVDRENWGLTASLNHGLELARGDYIARQDSDDISLPKRFKKEVAYLDQNPSIALVGSNYTLIDHAGKPLVTTNVFTHPNDLKLALIACNQYGHGSVMIRKSIFEKVEPYDSSVGYVEDYDLWVRISREADVANIEESLYLWRKTEESITHSNHELQIKQAFAVRDKSFEYFLKHRRKYRVLNFNQSGRHYRYRKAALYRDFAFLYRNKKRRFNAAWMLVLAILMQPKAKRNYRHLAKIFLKPSSASWEFEFL